MEGLNLFLFPSPKKAGRIEIMENNEIEPLSPEGSQKSGLNWVPNSSIVSISDIDNDVNCQYSDGGI